jgi:hypothetical protein
MGRRKQSDYAVPWQVDEIVDDALVGNGYKTTEVEDDGTTYDNPDKGKFSAALKEFCLNATPADEHSKSAHGFTKAEIYAAVFKKNPAVAPGADGTPIEQLSRNERAARDKLMGMIADVVHTGRSSGVNSALASKMLVLCKGEITRGWGTAEGYWVTADDALLFEAFEQQLKKVFGAADTTVFYGQFLKGRNPSPALAGKMAGALNSAHSTVLDKFKALGATGTNGNGKAVGTGTKKKATAPAIGAGTGGATAEDVVAEATADAMVDEA